MPWWAIALGIAVAGALIALLLIRGIPRRRPARSVVPLGRGLELEGTSSDTSIGRFRGTAYAVDIPAITDPGKRAEASRFFVLDPKRKLPFWVDYSDVDTPLPPALQAHPGPLAGGAELGPGTAVLGYVTVPKAVPERQAELYEQLAQIEGLCKRRRFELVGVVRDVEPNGDEVLDRPGIRYALEQFGAHRASALVVSDVRRLSVSRAQFDALLARLTAEEVALVALEPELDTSTDEGREVVRQLEIVRAERTKLAEAPPAPKPKPKPAAQRTTKAKAGRITGGGGAGAPRRKERIVAMRDRGESLKSIAEALNEEGVPPPRGGPQWRPASVRKTLGKEGAEESNKVVRLKAAPVPEPRRAGRRPARASAPGEIAAADDSPGHPPCRERRRTPAGGWPLRAHTTSPRTRQPSYPKDGQRQRPGHRGHGRPRLPGASAHYRDRTPRPGRASGRRGCARCRPGARA